MLEGGPRHGHLAKNTQGANLEAIDMVLLGPMSSMDLQEGGVSVAFAMPIEMHSLPQDRALEGSEAQIGPLKASTQPRLGRRERS